ncbi:MAG TPA: mechanosensitive ion channel domain-containing protein [Opitutaceae bacterium]|nr:mechanosensitive ion channel domain-containing protein [Opitutaceae bacterium]
MNRPRFSSCRALLCMIAAGAMLASATVFAAVDERATNLREKITTLETVVNSTKNASEKGRLEETLQRLRRELAVLEERQAIEERERQLRAKRPNSTIDLLRDKLRSIDVTSQDAKSSVQQIITRRRQAAFERDTLATQIAALNQKENPNTSVLVQAQERLFNKREELRALGLERDAAEGQIELEGELERLRARVKDFDAAGQHPTLKAMFDTYTLIGEGRRTDGRLKQQIANLEDNLKVSESALQLAQQRLEKFAEDLALLEKRTGFFSRDPQIDKLLAEERSQKDALNERMPFLMRQVDAIKRTQSELNARQELIALEATVQEEQLDALKYAYLQRLRWPAVALTGMIIIQVLAGYLLLPLFYKNESLVLARRLVRYIMVVAATVVVAGFLFDDLKMVAAAGGLVSAALVISLQDVCASVFAWFVIMIGGKFGIGDRLEVEGSQGDVIDIDLLRTTLLEVNGWLGTDQPTGRVITLPNNFIFKTKVFNFTHGHPYIWGKLELTVNAATPVAQAVSLFERVLEEEAGEQFAAAQAASATMRRRYGVEDAVYKPKVDVLIVDTGVLISLFYVAHYRQNFTTRTKIGRRLIAELEKHPHIQLSCPTLQLLHDNLVAGAPSAVLGAAGTHSAPRTTTTMPGGTAALRN